MKRLLKYSLVIALGFLIGCKNNKVEKPKKPDNLIKKDMMSDIIYDMAILSAAKGVNKKTIERAGITPDSSVYKKYGIDSLQFVLSNEYYSYDLEVYEEIYKAVQRKIASNKTLTDSLVNIEATQRREKTEELRKKRDSLNKTRKRGKDENLKSSNPLEKDDTLQK